MEDSTMNDARQQKTLSLEQEAILHSWSQGYSVKIQAVFGAGKTLCLLKALEIAYNQSTYGKIVFVSYNRDLVDEVIKKCNNKFAPGWQKRIFVGTYHSLLGSLTNEIVQDDLVFLDLLAKMDQRSAINNWLYRDFAHLLVDEGQDLRPPYFQILLQIIYRFSSHPFHLQRMQVGDEDQILYTFYSVNKADARFLTHIDQITPGNWKSHLLTTSYRATPSMAHFISFLFPNKHPIFPKPNCVDYKPVILLVTDIYNSAPDHLLPVIEQYIQQQKKIFILSSSTNDKSPCIQMVDRLVQAKIPTHVNRSGILNDSGNNGNNGGDQSETGVFVKTFHSAKGLESDLNIVYMRDNLLGTLTPAQYVALGRGREELIIALDYRSTTLDQLSLLTKSLSQRDLRIIVDRQLCDTLPEKKEEKEQDKFYNHSLFSFIDVAHLQKLVSTFTIVPITNNNITNVNVVGATDVYFQSLYLKQEQVNVAQIVGAAITYAVEFTITKNIPTCVGAMLTECHHKHDSKYKCLAREMDAVTNQLIYTSNASLKQSNEIQYVPNVVCQKLVLFAKMATLMDAFCGYTEKVASISQFDFIETPDLFQRYKWLFYNILHLLSTHNLQPQQLKWYKEDVGRYKYGEQAIRIYSKPTIAVENTLAVEIIHKPKITYEDHLRALISGQIVGSDQAACYVINIATGQMEQSKLHFRPQGGLHFIRSAINGKIFEEKSIEDIPFVQQYQDYIKNITQQY